MSDDPWSEAGGAVGAEVVAPYVELKPCPFCGKANKLKVRPYRADDDGGDPFDFGFNVICDATGFDINPNRGCGAGEAWGETSAEAIAAWNRRASQIG